MLKLLKVPLRLSKRECGALLVAGIPGVALTTLLLFSSYEYVSAGIATVLHFCYPLLVALGSALVFKEKLGRPKIFAVIVGFIGVSLFADKTSMASAPGIVMALLSAICYAVYMLSVGNTCLSKMHYLKLSLYLCLIASLASAVFAAATGTLNLHLTPVSWGYTVLLSMLTSVGAYTLLQYAIMKIGASSAAILSTFEPVTAVIMGIWILNETFTARKAFGCVLILTGVFLVALVEKDRQQS
jgi:drug/metabolite transporter (DMT)-like permease